MNAGYVHLCDSRGDGGSTTYDTTSIVPVHCIDTAIHDLVSGLCNGEIKVESNVLIRMERGEEETPRKLPLVLIRMTALLRHSHEDLDHQKESELAKEGNKEWVGKGKGNSCNLLALARDHF